MFENASPNQESKKRPPALAEKPLLLTVPEAAEILRIGRNTCYEFIRRGELPAVNLGERIIRIPRHGLEQCFSPRASLPQSPAEVVSLPQNH